MPDTLSFHDIDAVARQAVDLLTPDGRLTITETTRNNAYVYPQATGGDHGAWRVMVTLGPDNHTALFVEASRSRAAVLADLLDGLAGACGGRFRGAPFPPCPDGGHQATVRVEDDHVLLECPVEHTERVLVAAGPAPIRAADDRS